MKRFTFIYLEGLLMILKFSFLLLAPVSTYSAISSNRMTSTLAELMETFYNLDDAKKRAVSSVVGSRVADAATRPMHWLYDIPKLLSIVGNTAPEFWPENCSPFYSIATGKTSCYNDVGFVMLKSVLATHPTADFNKIAYIKSLQDFFSPTSEYAEALKLRLIAYDSSQRLLERVPIPGPWQQQSVTTFLQRTQAGEAVTGHPESTETDGFCGSIPLIAKLSIWCDNDRSAEELVEEATKVLSASPIAISHSLAAARILRKAISTGDISSPAVVKAVESLSADNILEEVQNVLLSISNGEEHVAAVDRFGKACGNPGNFQSALRSILSSDSFTDGVRKNILAGGCCCSRANFIGATLGAAHCIGSKNGIPLEWITKTDKGLEVFALALEHVACVV